MMARKETSSRISTIAAKCLKYPHKATRSDIKALAASCLSQDETTGQGIPMIRWWANRRSMTR